MTLSLVDTVFSAKRLSKRTVSGDHTIPCCSGLDRARTSAIATAEATAKATLADSIERAYVMLPYNDASPISVLQFPPSLNKSGGAKQLKRSVGLQCLTYSCAATTVLIMAYERPRGCSIGTTRSTWHLPAT